jgi:hypothetical protein
MTPLDPAVLEVQRRFSCDTPYWAGGVQKVDGVWRWPQPGEFEGCVKIVNKKKRLVPCIAHPWQLEFDELLERQRREGKPMRAIILKARKLGFSTWVAMKFLQRVTQMLYQVAIVCAQDVKTAGVIHNMAKTAYSNLPTEDELGLGFSIKPALIAAHFTATGRKFMEFGEPSRKLRMEGRSGTSLFEIDTAQSPEAGRGDTPNLLHLSEVAQWLGEQASRKMLSLLNAVPYEEDTIVILESTANGRNHFYRRWISARDGAGDPYSGETYAALFVPWWRDPNCRMMFATEGERVTFIESIGDEGTYGEIATDEKALIELYDLTAEQLFWRRSMIRTQHENNVQLFKQENPASDEEAFIGSGRTVFSGILVAKAIKAADAAPEPVQGSLAASGWETRRSRAGTIEVPTGAVWVPSGEMGRDAQVLDVWEHPRAEGELPPAAAALQLPTAASSTDLLAFAAAEQRELEQQQNVVVAGAGAYVIAVDVAEGEANTFTQGDYHCIQVFDHHTLEQVAVWESRMDVHEVPLWALLVALYYNRGWLAVEVNGPGIAVADPLHKDYRYSKMYRRRRIDKLTQEVEKKPGWETTKVTKPAMEATFGGALQEGTHGLRDRRTARQLSTYVIDEKGRHGAVHGEHDDRLMAAMIAHRVIETVRAPRPAGARKLREPTDPVTGY